MRARPTLRTIWSTLAGTPPRPTKIPPGPSKPSWSFPSGTLTDSVTTRSAPSSIGWASRPCAFSMPYHDIRRPLSLSALTYSVSANIGRTLMACRQAVVDIRCCLDWLEEQGYEHFGVLGTSLGFLLRLSGQRHDSAHPRQRFQPRLNGLRRCHLGRSKHPPPSSRLSTKPVLTQDRVRELWAAVSPCYYYPKFCRSRIRWAARRKSLLVYGRLRSHLPREYSLQVVDAFRKYVST